MKENPDIINVFWTGGLDSTFRLVQSLINTQARVQPHYIVRHEDSTGIEIDAMIQIRRAIINKFPDVRTRFLPTIYTNEDLIPRYKETNEIVEELRKIAKVREQYHILSDYCKAFKVEKIQLSLVKSPGEMMFIENFSSSPIFKSFEYPNKDLTKRELYEISRENQWDDILLMTSFCRRPIKKVTPCGVCGPCADSTINGMGFRLPFRSRIKARIQIPFRKYWRKNYLKQDQTRFFRFIKRKFESKF